MTRFHVLVHQLATHHNMKTRPTTRTVDVVAG